MSDHCSENGVIYKSLGFLGHPGYQVGSDGSVWKKIKPFEVRGGYLQVDLSQQGCYIHRLVLEAFVGQCPPGEETRHLNGDQKDNRLDNLCWGTKKENGEDRVKHGTSRSSRNKGEDNPQAKLNEESVRSLLFLWKTGGHKKQKLAEMFGISTALVRLIIRGERWGHVSTEIVRDAHDGHQGAQGDS